MKEMIQLYKKYLSKYKFKALLGPFFKLIEACFELIVPLVVKNIIDIGIKQKNDINYILKMGGLLLLLAVIGLCSTLICQYFAAKVSMKAGTKLRKDLYEHISTLSLEEIDKATVSSLQTIITTDTMTFQTSVAMFMRLVVRAPFIVIGATIMAFTISIKVGFIFVIAGILIGLILFIIMKNSLPYNRAIQSNTDDITRITKENLTGARVVRAFNMQSYEKKRYDDKSDELEFISEKLAKLSSLLNPLMTAVINIALIAILYFGAFEVNVGSLTDGDITSLLNYMTQISVAIAVVANLVVVFSKASAASERIQRVFNLKSSIKDGEIKEFEENEEIISFENVSFAYHKNSDRALNNISFTLKQGQVTGIIGGTGAGKTTIINLISRLYDADEGQIKIYGKDIKIYSLEEIRKLISVVPQNSVLFSGTIKSNLTWRKDDVNEDEMWKCLEIAQAKEFVKKKELQLDEVVLQGGKNFSGGQRQRLTIARALIDNPKVLILDDSSSALDYKTDADMRAALKRECKDMCVIMVSQRATSIKNVDQIIVLDNGKIDAIGKHDELYLNSLLYREICDSQVKKEERYEKK